VVWSEIAKATGEHGRAHRLAVERLKPASSRPFDVAEFGIWILGIWNFILALGIPHLRLGWGAVLA
jgi:hypothetical protein